MIKLLTFVSFTVFAAAQEAYNSSDSIQLKPLFEAMDKGGLTEVNSYLNKGGKWPRISTDSFAIKHKINNQAELKFLSDRIVTLLQERSVTEPSSEIPILEAEAKLLFNLSEKLWKSEGYRNRVISLLCVDLAAHRCGRIVIASRGLNLGPERPEIFNVSNADVLLKFFVAMIPEQAALSETKLGKILIEKPVAGKNWLEMVVGIRKIEIGNSTVSKKFDNEVAFRLNYLGAIYNEENISALVYHYGAVHAMYNSMLPALAMYLKNGGSLNILLQNPTNATKFEEVMKDGVYKFSMSPVMSSGLNGSALAGLVESVQNPIRLSQRLFGTQPKK